MQWAQQKNNFYSRLAESPLGKGAACMNFGYSEGHAQEFAWVNPADYAHRYHFAMAKALLSGANLKEKRLLDVGCGRGGMARYFLRYEKIKTIYGIDLNQRNIDICRKHNSSPRAFFSQADAQALPFESGFFDALVNIESSHWYEKREDFYLEARRVLRRGGLFFCADIVEKKMVKTWERSMKRSSLHLIRSADVTPFVLRSLRKTSKNLLIGKGISREGMGAWLVLQKMLQASAEALDEGSHAFMFWRLRAG